MKRWIIPSLLVLLLFGVAFNGFLYNKQSALIRNNETQITNLQNDIDSVKNRLTDLSSSLGILQSEVTSTKGDIALLNRATQNLTVTLSILSDLVNNLSNRQIADFTRATDIVKPSVVAINVEVITTFFPGFRIPQQAAASGWIIRSDGVIVTNSHVVDDATPITVTLADGRTFTPVAIQSDRQTDLAVIKIDATALPTAKIGDSDALRVGQPVAAIGNALGLGINLSGGWVSRLNASVTFSDGSSLSNLIGTDAAINPGNSGGPLINIDGEVVGITNIKWVETGVEGIGYAISINDAITTIASLYSKF